MSGFKGLMLFSDGKCVKSVKECFWYLRPNQSLRLSSHQHKQPLCLQACITPLTSSSLAVCGSHPHALKRFLSEFELFWPRVSFIHLLQTDLELRPRAWKWNLCRSTKVYIRVKLLILWSVSVWNVLMSSLFSVDWFFCATCRNSSNAHWRLQQWDSC